MSESVNTVRAAIIPHPMSTPTAAGITASRVGITVPTADPFPKCASGINATCGCTKGIDAVCFACSIVLSSISEAKFSSL